MKNILILGAGKSATCLIHYLAGQAKQHHFTLTVADGNLQLAADKTALFPSVATAVQLDVTNAEQRNALIEKSTVVISMLPPALHYLVAENCLSAGRHLLTASYVDDSIRQMERQIKEKGLLFLCEMGLDPGIDHMSALQLIHNIQKAGGSINSFYSHCGGLVAPESDDNPWHYKISWNPRNVVLAGKAGAVYRLDGKTKQLDYGDLFDAERLVTVPGSGSFAWYPNRDSLPYIELYGLANIQTFVRTTLRHPQFCLGWKKIVELGLTDENSLLDTDRMTYQDFLSWHHNMHPAADKETGAVKTMFDFLGLYDNSAIDKGKQNAANILQSQLEKKLALQPQDKDMIVMLHEIEYEIGAESKKLCSWLVVKGDDHLYTAMAKTVGLPLGIAACLLLQDKISLRGLQLPLLPEIYEPVMEALKAEGIAFEEKTD